MHTNEHTRLAQSSHARAAVQVMNARSLIVMGLHADQEAAWVFVWFADRSVARAERYSREAELHERKGGTVFPGGEQP